MVFAKRARPFNGHWHMCRVSGRNVRGTPNSSEMPDASGLAEMIASDFYNNQFDLSERGLAPHTGWSLMPEVEGVRWLRTLGTPERSIRVFLTMVSAMDRARDATRLWRVGVELFESHPEVFDPAQVLSMPANRVSELLSESGVSQRHGPDAGAWHSIAGSLVSGAGSVCRVVDSGVGDARELLEDLQSHDRAGRPRYPMLRGPKIGPMWVRIMANPGGATIERIDTIPVAVDVQVRRATENLGVTDTRGLRLDEAKHVIQAAWHTAVRAARIGGPSGIAGTCAALDPSLWFLGKYGCSQCEKIGQREPVSRACENCRFPLSPTC